MYRHTQPGYMVIGMTGAGAAFALKKLAAGAAKAALLPVTAILAGVGFVFSSLTVEIKDGMLRSYFGPGVPAKSFALADVASAEIVRNKWYYGWGIKYTPHGWLYNVSGLDAVEIRLKSGEQFRLGTDEPEALRAAILSGATAPA